MRRLIFFLPLFFMLFASINVEAKKKKYPNGDYYEGEWKNGNPNGKGTMVFANGNTYKGEWILGKITGIGRMDYKDGSTYDGEWKEGNKIKGKLSLPNKDRYDGVWNNDNDGKGVIHYNNKNRYTGEWKDLVPHGEGYMIYADDLKKEGNWIAGSLHDGKEIKKTQLGICKIDYLNGLRSNSAIVEIDEHIYYVGKVIDYVPSGLGQIVMGVYTMEGEFLAGVPIKQGVIKSSSSSTTLSFTIKDGSIQGTIKYPYNTIEDIIYEKLIITDILPKGNIKHAKYKEFYNWFNEKVEKTEIELKKRQLKKEKEKEYDLYAKQNLKTYRNEKFKVTTTNMYREIVTVFNFDDVEYQYYTRSKEDVYHGTFRLWNGISVNGGSSFRYSVMGTFKHGQKDGVWVYEEEYLRSRFIKRGRVTVNYIYGEADGIYTLEYFDNNGSLIFKEQKKLKNGEWDKKNSDYYYYNERETVERKMSFNAKGEIDGNLYMRKGDVELKETYKNGKLIKSEMYNLKKKLVLTSKQGDNNYQKMWEETTSKFGYDSRLTGVRNLIDLVHNIN